MYSERRDLTDILGRFKGLHPLIESPAYFPERFARKVAVAPTGCWIWEASRNQYGYGQFYFAGQPRKAHRLAYEWAMGEIPVGLEIDHLCKVRECVNPAHLEPVTHRENLLRGDTFQAANAAKTHCKRGHEFSPENTRVVAGRWRKCRTCMRNEARLRMQAKRRAGGCPSA